MEKLWQNLSALSWLLLSLHNYTYNFSEEHLQRMEEKGGCTTLQVAIYS